MRYLWLVLTSMAAVSRIATAAEGLAPSAGAAASPSAVISLDGPDWLLAPDPKNVGREEKWFQAPRPAAKKTKAPWIIQDAFPGYHGVAWYWRDFTPPANDRPGGRTLLRFWPWTTRPTCGSTDRLSGRTRGASRCSRST